MSDDPRIKCSENGPYVVSGLEHFTATDGEAVEVKPVMALCRCGASNNKPFCDGTHARISFTGDKLEGRVRDQRDTYEGRHITIFDNRGVCSHAGYCTTDFPAVWRMGEEPWVDADGSTPDDVIETIKECPSGALSYALDGEEYRDQDRAPSIEVVKDGPYHVVGGVELSTNLLTGLWEAKVDRAPILALSGQVQTQVFGPGWLPGHRPAGSVRTGRAFRAARPPQERSRRTDFAGAEERDRRA